MPDELKLRKSLIRLAAQRKDLRPHLLPLLAAERPILKKASGPPLPRIGPKAVAEALSLYWSPRQQRIDPTMMGNSSAKDVAPLVVEDFRFDAANEFVQSSWVKAKAKELRDLVANTMGKGAEAFARNISWHIYSAHRGSIYWREVFSTKDMEKIADALNTGSIQGADKLGITHEQQQVVGKWLSNYVDTLKNYERKLAAHIKQKVEGPLKKLLAKANKGVPPEKW